MKLNFFEIEMLKYLNRRKSVPPWRLRLNFPICFKKITGNLYCKSMITRTYKEDDEIFLKDTLIMLPGTGNYVITTKGQNFLDEWKQGYISKIWGSIKFIFVTVAATIITYYVNLLLNKL